MNDIVWIVEAADIIDSVWTTEADANDRLDQLDNEGAEATVTKFKLNTAQGMQ